LGSGAIWAGRDRWFGTHPRRRGQKTTLTEKLARSVSAGGCAILQRSVMTSRSLGNRLCLPSRFRATFMEQQYFLSPELAHRLAAIDIGTNSIRLVVAEARRGGNYRILDEEKETTRLGRGLATTGRLDPEAVTRSLAVLRHLEQIAAGFQVREIKTIATCAVREAADGEEFCRRVKAETSLDVEIISAQQEAELAFFSVV